MYWSLRERSRNGQNGVRDVLTVIIDGMDKSKFALPRYSLGRTPKDSTADKVARPNLEVTAVLCHGVGCYLFVGDERKSSGASFKGDCILRSLDRSWTHCQKRGRQWPSDLSVHGDNTVAEIKNSIIGKLLCCLVAEGHFRCAGHQHLRVGHTHEDVDALFGLMSQIIKDAGEVQTPQDVVNLLHARLADSFATRGEDFHIFLMEDVRDVEQALPWSIRLSGAYSTVDQVEAPHSFMFVPRAGIPSALLRRAEQVAPYHEANHHADVFLLIRQWMADDRLSQRPLLVMPATLNIKAKHSLADLAKNVTLVLPSMDAARQAELHKLADFFMDTYGKLYERGAKYLRDVADCVQSDRRLPELLFLQQPPRFDQKRLCFKQAPDEAFVPRRMIVEFATDPHAEDVS